MYLERTHEFAVTTVASASAALDRIKSNGIQAIVSDYQMPGMDGIGFLKQVRAKDKTIPFILFTGRGREEVAVEAFENGADYYLQKGGSPIPQFTELMHKIRTAVDHRKDEAMVATLNRLYAVLSATNKAIVHIHDKKELLNEICRIVVDEGGFAMAWAGLVNNEKQVIESIAVSGHADNSPGSITISIDDIPGGHGPAGIAVRERTFIVCNDIEHDPLMAPWRTGALAKGYRSLAAFPFALDSRNAGVITFYAAEPGFFNDRIIRLLKEQSGDVSFALVTLDHEEQRIAAENNLETSELQYRRLFQTAQDAILILDGDTGEVIDANKFILDMLGYPLEYFVGKHLWELGFIKDKSVAQKSFTELKTNGYIRYENIPLETKDGKSFNVEFISNVYLVGDKKIIQCNIRDITDKKVIQDTLQASETRYHRLFETAQDGILILDAGTGQIVEVNPFLISMLGFSHEQFLGKKLWEIGLFKDVVANKDNFEKLQQKAYLRYEDLPLETADGHRINVEFISNVYLVGDKKIIQCNIRDITARKRAEASLAESYARLDSVLEGSPMMQFVIDKDHRVISWNRALEEYSGIKKADVLGTRNPWKAFYDTERPVFADLLVDEKVELLPEWYQGKFNTSRLVEGAYECSDFFPKMGGSGRWMSLTAAPIRDTSGEIIGAVETLEDITERKRVLDEIEKARDEWECTFNAIPDLIAIIDDRFRIVQVNKAMADRLGVSPEGAVGQSCYEIFHHSKSPPDICPHRLLLADGKSHTVDIHEDTLNSDFSLSVSPVFDHAGKVTGSVHILHDITTRKRAEEEHVRLAAIVESSDDAIVGKTLEGIIVSWNAGAKLIYGYTAEEASGKSISILVPPGERDETPAILERIRAGERISHLETKRRTRDGRIIDVSLTISPIKNDEGVILGASTIARDITERKQMENALALAGKKLHLLSRITRHDINNQLMALNTYLQLSKDAVDNPAELKGLFDKEQEIADAIASQISFTGDYENIGVKAPVWQNVHDIFRNVIARLPMRDIRVDLENSDLELFADPLLEKVFYNLTDNALRYGGERMTVIRVTTRNDKGTLVIAVEDDGKGVSIGDKKQLFNKGFGRHTGLGLFLSREILLLTGITITENGEPGRGARFEISVQIGGYRFGEGIDAR